MRIAAAVVDSSAFTQHVYRFTNDRFHRNIYAGKGVAGEARPIVDLSQRLKRGARKHLVLVGTFAAKDLAYSRFKRRTGATGCVHWPEGAGFSEEYFNQLTSERKTLSYRAGKMVTSWVLPMGLRNEALDCWVYALAAVHVLNPVYSALERRLQPVPQAEAQPAQEEPQAEAQPPRKRPQPAPQRRRGGFVRGW
jgi:phage terminase large subunit GpA-like protein